MHAHTRELMRSVWHRIPFPAMTLLVLALYLIKEEFPFSNFPMYSRISEEADVVFVTDQKNEPLPMKALFKTSSATSKKMYKKELAEITNPLGRDSELATAEERRRAGAEVLALLSGRLVGRAIPEGVTALRFHVRTFRAGVDPDEGSPPELLAEWPLPTRS